MRHFLGLLLGVVVTAVLLAGTGWASQDAARGMASAAAGAANAVDPVRDTKALVGLGAMLVAGLLLGLVLAGRVSPLATFVPSMALLAWTVIYALDVNRALSLAPTDPALDPLIVQAGKGMQDLLARGVYALAGIALFIPVLMPSRWASRRDDLDDDYEEGVESPQGYY
ncbi:hypothetical protein Skr01_40000 [Sphaerisporangium krabiense]|uniref:Uncharacterized protein n=1 Tax=Sphaerisporangium krabiense TaxID=763782 RepID=A0A7W8Z9G0_9ACTN|nr:hypothetical protein [Sphaerisporangium krabiense]MBB5629816.1 hypothetical protein [Sphaerisporangium krabiense]GII63915.1 hypothetical protein Skr01_40000 [Sphaerisporangium krabiense]